MQAKLALEVEERSRQILRSERLAGIGFFASGISHEINNPLQAIGAAAESLTSRMHDGSLGKELPAEDRELVLERFYRRPGAVGDGCGLGLSIANEIAARHGADLIILVSPGGGTRVQVTFVS